MKKSLMSLLAACALSSQTHAEEIKPDTAARFIATFYQAIQQHDLTTVSRMIDDHVVIKVLWIQAAPAQTFSLSKADYLQQLKATWHFASNDHYEIKNLTANIVNGVAVVTLQDNESRVLFGNKAGQLNNLKISLSGDNGNPRIATITSQTAFL
ncbi:hypothetical protein [Aquirhabdus parva]|uniref:Nuclear transport factor 2 family protein n=1 Tax=Aquirhabdus parva TaxID=2283318 RepID=A0A345P9M5_9GAMM|nr:hypothetical protein [Aquirhabdus parva]AXI03984.1 hypothetical protein HYN46_14725 [Aquirhabdus parva]